MINKWSARFDPSFFVPLTAFENVMDGKAPDSVKPRWDTCITEVSQRLPHALGATYIQRQFPPEDKSLAVKVILAIRQEYKERFQTIDWMDEKAKKMAAKKGMSHLYLCLQLRLIVYQVDQMSQFIGYQTERPNEVDPKSVADYYSSLKITDDFLQNQLNGILFSLNINWQKLLAPTDRSHWDLR